ncbi:MAG: polyhydroxyalkanoic acid system family protein [Myxococcales bacterium]
MPKFQVDIPHSLPPDDVKKRLSGATHKIESAYGATCTWKNERQLSVARKGFDALVSIEDSRVHVDMNLGFLLVPMAGAIKNGLTKELSSLLGAVGPVASS